MSRKVLKYQSLKQLISEYKSGNLIDPITINKDECFVAIPGVGRVYENDTEWLLKAALDLLGIPYKS